MARVLLFAAAFLFVADAATAQSSRFYVRGDLGLALGTPSVETDTNPGSATASLGADTINGTFGNGMIFDAGVGYRAFSFLRLEGSIGYIPNLTFGGAFGSTTSSTTYGNVSALIGFATANFDLTALTGRLPGGFQPFVLGGVGFANIANGGENDYSNGTYRNTFGGATTTNLAWTVGGGIGIPLADRLTLDVTYRWLDLGERRVGPILNSFGSLATLTQDRADLRVHAIMLGLRYEL
jgi:opacity protein-like surface antigen